MTKKEISAPTGYIENGELYVQLTFAGTTVKFKAFLRDVESVFAGASRNMGWDYQHYIAKECKSAQVAKHLCLQSGYDKVKVNNVTYRNLILELNPRFGVNEIMSVEAVKDETNERTITASACQKLRDAWQEQVRAFKRDWLGWLRDQAVNNIIKAAKERLSDMDRWLAAARRDIENFDLVDKPGRAWFVCSDEHVTMNMNHPLDTKQDAEAWRESYYFGYYRCCYLSFSDLPKS